MLQSSNIIMKTVIERTVKQVHKEITCINRLAWCFIPAVNASNGAWQVRCLQRSLKGDLE